MKTSARNALRGRVKAIVDGVVNTEVVVDIGHGTDVVAIVTRHSVETLALAMGAEVTALIKASFIILVAGDGEIRASARNRMAGTVTGLEDGAVNSEVTLELDGGQPLVATITRHSVAEMDLKIGDRATAPVKASHVILALE